MIDVIRGRSQAGQSPRRRDARNGGRPSIVHAVGSSLQSAALWAVALACVQVAACSQAPSPAVASRVDLVVYAATSTRDALGELESDYEAEHAVDLIFNFGSSGDLARQIVAAAAADLFVSADEKEMDRVEAAGLLLAGTRAALWSNQLVVVEPSDRPTAFRQPFEPAQLSDASIEWLSLGNVDTVPAGRYAKAWLVQAGLWDSVAARVLPGVDVRAALAAVESGGAQAGIVYRTDVARSTRARVVFAVPQAQGPEIRYSVAAVASRPHEARSREFLAFLAGARASEVFERHGFLSAASSTQR